MYELLSLTITLHLWHLLLLITIVTFFIAAFADNETMGTFLPIPCYVPLWLVVNFLMWLVYFIIV